MENGIAVRQLFDKLERRDERAKCCNECFTEFCLDEQLLLLINLKPKKKRIFFYIGKIMDKQKSAAIAMKISKAFLPFSSSKCSSVCEAAF